MEQHRPPIMEEDSNNRKEGSKRRPPDEGEGTGNRSTIAPGNQRVGFQGRITRPRIAIGDRFARNEPIKKHGSFCTARPCGMRRSCVYVNVALEASFNSFQFEGKKKSCI